MGTSKLQETNAPKTESFININQKIILPENYKKFSTIKLRIKPAKVIFFSRESNSQNLQNISSRSSKENEGEEYNNLSLKTCNRSLRLNPSYLFSSAEYLSFINEEFKRNPTNFRINQKLNNLHVESDNKIIKKETIVIDPALNEESEIIKELVLGKFKDLLQKFIEKSNRRRMFSMDQEENRWPDCMHFLDPCPDMKGGIQCNSDDTTHNRAETLLDAENLKSEIVKEQPRENHMEHKFIKTYGPQNEVLQEKGEMLHPHHTCIISQKAYRTSSYVHISEPMETVQSLQFIERRAETIDSQSIHTDPSEEDLISEEKKYLKKTLKDEINEQTCAILQVLKVLSMCERNKKISDSILRVEAERVFLIANLRRDILTEELSKSYNGNEEDWNGFVLLSNLRIPLNQIHEIKIKQTRFFLCIFRCGCTVFSSELLMLNSNMELEIEDPICFDELSTDFEITVEIYTMHLIMRKKSKGMKILKKYRNFFFGPRLSLSNCATEESTKKSAFTLIGSTKIDKSHLQFREFPIENKNTLNFTLEELKCTIGSGVKLDIFLSGFLMVCESCGGKTRWRRQWCILDASELKFWDYPGKEDSIAPNRIIDLSRSLLPYIMLADKKFCSRPRSLHLKIGPDSAHEEFYHKDIFLAADNPRDFLLWEKELNRVLKNLINWGCMKTYFENSL